ncbi:MAG: S26 family signal peptidase [Acutalibacteraceae bacterium]
MQQTIFDGDKVVLNNQNYEPKRGYCSNSENGTQLDTAIIKRVIAVAGQTVDIDFHTGTVYVDGWLWMNPNIRKRQYYKGRRNAISTDGSG